MPRPQKIVTVQERQKARGLALCPWHFERTPSLMIDFSKESFRCFGCERKGEVIPTLTGPNTVILELYE